MHLVCIEAIHHQASVFGLISQSLSLTGGNIFPYKYRWDISFAISRFKCEDGEGVGDYSKRVKKEVVGPSEWTGHRSSDSNNNSDNNAAAYYAGVDHLNLQQHNV